MATITFDLPAETLAALRRSPVELAHDVRLGAAIYWYARGELSQQRAAETAGLDRTEFMKACSRAGVNVFESDAAEFDSPGDSHG